MGYQLSDLVWNGLGDGTLTILSGDSPHDTVPRESGMITYNSLSVIMVAGMSFNYRHGPTHE